MNNSHCALLCLLLPFAALDAQDPAAKPPEQPPPPTKGLSFQVGDFKVKFGGYVKVDVIHDFDEIGSTDSFDPRTIPTDDEVDSGMNTRVHAKSTRLNLDVTGPTSMGDMRLYVEGDFFGDGNSFRMRHAFGTVGGILGGQTWSTFMDEDAMPETLDFDSAIAYPLIRQAQVRYTAPLGDGGSYWAVAIEDPQSSVLTNTPGEIEEATPDLTGRLRWAHGCGHCQLGLFAGTARFDDDVAPSDTELLWGVNLSGKFELCRRDKLFVVGTYGPGVGRYRGGYTAVADTNGQLEAVDLIGAMLGYEHHWCDTWRSTITYSWGKADDLPAATPLTSNEQLEYLAANLIWQFNERAWAGVEYLYGSRETLDGAHGEANRLQFAVRFDF